MEYKASLDTLAKVITTGVGILFIAIGQQNVRVLFISKGETTTILIHNRDIAVICSNFYR